MLIVVVGVVMEPHLVGATPLLVVLHVLQIPSGQSKIKKIKCVLNLGFPLMPDIREYSWIISFIFEKKSLTKANIFRVNIFVFISNIFLNTTYRFNKRCHNYITLLKGNGLRKLNYFNYKRVQKCNWKIPNFCPPPTYGITIPYDFVKRTMLK